MNCAHIAKLLSERLNLKRPPIGLAFLSEPPAGVKPYPEPVPTACTFWKAAEKSLFYTTGEDHFNCPIGAITQGFNPPQEVMQQGMALIGQMGKIRYFDPAEVEHVPTVKKPHQVIVYGPLKDFQTITPDVAMVICSPFQAMLLSEAVGAVAWQGTDNAAHLFGRPACAVIPSAMQDNATSASVGCMGARTFAEIGEDQLLVAIPAARLEDAERQLDVIAGANDEMRAFYANHKSRFAAV